MQLLRHPLQWKGELSLMNASPIPERRRSERLPGKGEEVLLLTHRGKVSGVLVDYSETGALVMADGSDLAGRRVVLCLKEKGEIRQREGMVVMVSAIRGIAIQFDLAARAQEQQGGHN